MLSPEWKKIDVWPQARKLINDIDYDEWLDKNPIPEYDNRVDTRGVLQEDGCSYMCPRGHKWKI